MLNNASGFDRIYIATGRTDLRQGIDGLCATVRHQLGIDPFQKNVLFMFCGRKPTKIKCLVWEGDGFLLLYKRLQDGCYQWPRATQEVREMSQEHFVIHLDRGCHYRWPGCVERMEKAGLTCSMSKKGCSPDNSACEGFYGRLKNEMFYNHSWAGVTIEGFIHEVNKYLDWYCNKRIKLSLGGLSPIAYRHKL